MTDFTKTYGPVDALPLPTADTIQEPTAVTGSVFKQEFAPAPPDIPISVGAENPTALEAVGAGMLEFNLAFKALRPHAWDDFDNQAVPGYDPRFKLEQIRKNSGSTLGADQEAELLRATSDAQMDAILEMQSDKDQRQAVVDFNKLGYLPMVIDPTDWFLGGVGKAGALMRAGTMTRAAAGATAATALTLAPNSTDDTLDHMLDILGGTIATAIPLTSADRALIKERSTAKLQTTEPWTQHPTTKWFAGIKDTFKQKAAGDKPTFTNALVGGLQKMQSVYDEVALLGAKGKDIADRVLGKPFEDASASTSAAAYQRNFMADNQRAIKEVEVAMTRAGMFSWHPHPAQRAAARIERENVGVEVQRWLHRERLHVKQGGAEGEIPLPTDPKVRAVIESYHNSNFAKTTLRRAKAAGVEGAKEVVESRSYVPVVWNYDRVRAMTHRGISESAIAKAFGSQIVRQFGTFADSDAENMGLQFLKTIQGNKTGDLQLKLRDWEINGLTREEMVTTLRAFGTPDAEVLRAVDQFFGSPNLNSVGDVTKSLRQRLDWDFDEIFHADGQSFTLANVLEPDIHKSMERYTLEMTSRIGLAHAGFRAGGDLQKALDEAADEAMAAGQSPEAVRQALDHLREIALGRPVGDQIPDWLRSMTALGSGLALKNSGIYNLAEYSTLAHEYGIKATLKEFMPALKKNGVDLMTKQDGEDLSDIITGRLFADGRFRPVVTYLEDNFEGAVDSVNESIQYTAQSIRFLNGSEQIRRHQIKLFAGLYQKKLEAAFKGDAKAVDFLTEQGLDNTAYLRAHSAYKRHGWDMDKWPMQASDDLSTHALTIADSTVLAMRKGERPRLMDSAVGKAIFPFMSFVFSAHNKILRRNFAKDGVAGVATIMAYQMPLAVLAGVAANVSNGKSWNEDPLQGTVKSMSALGLYSMPFDLITRGRMGGSFTGFAPINSTMELLSVPEDLQGYTQNVPFVATIAPLNLAIGAMQQKGE